MKLIIILLPILALATQNWNFLTFSQVWGPSWSDSAPKKFIIHGIWPDFNSTYFPSYCNISSIKPFNITSLKSIIPQLRKHWTNFRPNLSEFWKHEYYKHYSCARTDPIFSTEFDYFHVGLQLYFTLNIQTVLSSHGIIPLNKKYITTNVSSILNNFYNVDVLIICENNKMLNEIRICLNRSLKLINCNQYLECKSKEVIY